MQKHCIADTTFFIVRALYLRQKLLSPYSLSVLRSEASMDKSATAPEAGGKNNPASFSFCGSRLVLLDNLVSYREYLMDSLVADIFVHIDTA